MSLYAYMEEQGVEQCFLIQIGQDETEPEYHQIIREAQLEICEEAEGMTLVSTLPGELNGAEMKDEGRIHFTQEALNLIGTDAGTRAGAWVRQQKETGRKG